MSVRRPGLILVLLAVTCLASTSAVRAAELSAEQMQRVLAIKALQQRRLMEELLEGEERAEEAPERRERILRAAIAARAESLLAAKHGANARILRGIRQRPADNDGREAREAVEREHDRGSIQGPLRLDPVLRTQAIATNVSLNNPNFDDIDFNETQSEMSLAAWGSYALAAWNDGHGSRLGHFIGYSVSTNAGQSFVDRGGPPTLILPTFFWTSDPVVTVNEKTGEFYFCALIEIVGDTDGYGVGTIRGTFSGSNFTWDTPRIARFIDPSEGFIDKPWIVADSTTGNLYLSYTRFAGGADSIIFVRSTNKGVAWGPSQTLSRSDAAGWVQGSRPAVGPSGELYVVWKEINQSGGLDFFRIRKSTNAGVSFGPEVTAATMPDNFGSGSPGFNRELGITFPSISVDRSNGPRRGRVYLAWNESVDFYDSVPDDLPALAEFEPNDQFTAAQPFTPGDVLVGNCSYTDFDFYSFNATQGTTYVFWTPGLGQLYTLRVLCSDHFTRLAFTGDTADPPGEDGFIVWTAPANGTYYLRIVLYEPGAPATPYRIRTSVDQPGSDRSRDHRDIMVASSADGSNFGVAVRVNQDPGLYDNWLPEIAVDGEGTVYTTWYDFSDGPAQVCGGAASAYVARSGDGGATWLSLGAASEFVTQWTRSNDNIIPNQGDYIALFANAARVYPAWADARFGNADTFTAPFLISGLQVAVENVVTDTSHVAITWRATGATSLSARVLRKGPGDADFVERATITSDGTGRLFYDDLAVVPGATYQYKLVVVLGGTPVELGQRTVIVPLPPTPTSPLLAMTATNPTTAVFRVRFTLPVAGVAWLTLFDLTGRRLREWDVSSMGLGVHTIPDFAEGLDLTPGMYTLRLTLGEEERRTRVMLLP